MVHHCEKGSSVHPINRAPVSCQRERTRRYSLPSFFFRWQIEDPRLAKTTELPNPVPVIAGPPRNGLDYIRPNESKKKCQLF